MPIVNRAADFSLNVCIAVPSLTATFLRLRSEMRGAERFSATELLRVVWQFCVDELSTDLESVLVITLVENPAA
jgi:hypothetical protein